MTEFAPMPDRRGVSNSDNSNLPQLERAYERMEYDPVGKLLEALPAVGQAIAGAHCEMLAYQFHQEEFAPAREIIRRLASDPHDVTAHEPKWHQWGIPQHTENVVRAAFGMLVDSLGEQDRSVQVAVRYLQGEMLNGVSLFKLFMISIPLHDIGKYQPIIKPAGSDGAYKPGHTGHEARSGDLIQLAASDGCPYHLYVLKNIFKESRITEKQIVFIEQCARLHYEFGKIRERAKETPEGYTLAFLKHPKFAEACDKITSQHDRSLNFVKGLYFLVDNAGKVDAQVTERYMRLQKDGGTVDEEMLNTLLAGADMPMALKGAVQQFPVNRAVALAYLDSLSS